MKRRILSATGVLVAGVAFSGCITQTGFHWSDPMPKKGEATKGILELRGIEGSGVPTRGGAEPDKAYFYVQIEGEGSGFNLKDFKFDTKEKLGKTKEMVSDPALGGAANECGPVSGPGGETWRTKKPVDFSPVDKLIEATFKAKMNDGGGALAGFIQSGQWVDDGDGVAEAPDSSDDEYSCSGFTSTFVGTKGFNDAPNAAAVKLP